METSLKSMDIVPQFLWGVSLTDRTTWYRLRRDMFEQLRAEVRDHLGPESSDIASARRALDAEVRRPWKVAVLEDLSREWARHKVILMGDFHALQQSQKIHLRLLTSLPGPVVLALECVRSSAQKELDAFMAGRLSEAAFLRKIKWDETWGFPWDHYRPMFLWARAAGVPVVALNSSFKKLSKRDEAAAKVIGRTRKKWPDRKVVVIFGDLHLGRSGLPAALRAQKVVEREPLRIFQNVEEAYFRLLKKGLDHKVDLIRWDARTYAVQSVPPWVKWQNYLLWFEQHLDAELEEEGESPDPTDTVARMVGWLGRELELSTDASALTVFHASEEGLWSRIRKEAGERERPWLELMIEDGRSFFLSSAGWGYLARASVNHAASLAMQFLHDRTCGGARVRFRFPEDLERVIWVEAVAYFGSKIINPKRKSDTLADLRSSLSSHQAEDRGREALRLALAQRMKEMMDVSGRTSTIRLPQVRRKSSWIAAGHLLGAMLGERLYHGYSQRVLSRDLLHRLLMKPVGHERFDLMYREILEIMEAVPAPFRSKKDRL